MATYKYFTNAEYDNIVGAYLMGMANDKLKWQRTQDINIGVDAQFFGSLTFRFDYYVSNTDNLLVDFDLSGSTGFNTFKENLGEVQNKGFDATLNWRVYNNTEKDRSSARSARRAPRSVGASLRRAGFCPCRRRSARPVRSEERRVGKECRSRWSPYH